MIRTMPDTHEARCRELAELTVRREASLADHIYGETTDVLDPRFASLRGQHEWYDDDEQEPLCLRCLSLGSEEEGAYCLRTDGDALDEAIAACGWIVMMRWDGERFMVCVSEDNFIAPPQWTGWFGEGSTPREAKSAALWQAVFG